MALGTAVDLHPTTKANYRWVAHYRDEARAACGRHPIRKKYFRSKEDALAFKRDREFNNRETGLLSAQPAPVEKQAIAEARENDVPLLEAVSLLRTHGAALNRLKKLGGSLEQILGKAIEHLEEERTSITVDELRSAYLDELELQAHSATHLSHHRSRLGRFAQDFGTRLIVSITPTDIQKWLRSLGLKPTTLRNYRVALVSMFGHAVFHNGLQSNPAKKVAVPKDIEKEPAVLTPAQARKLINNAPPPILPYVVLGLFCGIRREEFEKGLTWQSVNFDDRIVTIPAAIAKKHRRRIITLRENAIEFLLPYRSQQGRIWPRNGRKLLDEAKGSIQPWLQNGLRHSFATYALAAEKNIEALTLEMGHKDTSVLFDHYRALRGEKVAREFWAIRPTKSKVVAIG